MQRFSLVFFILSFLLGAGLTASKAQKMHGEDENGDKLTRNSLYIETLGNGLISTFNYDVRFGKEIGGIGMSIGAGGFSYRDVQFFTTPLMVNYLLGAEGSYFELGIGISYYGGEGQFLFVDQANSLMGTSTIGFRFQPSDGGFFFRANVTPTFGNFGNDPDCNSSDDCDNRKFVFWPFYGGLSFGFTF